jgi:hypothetical protein
VRCNSCSQRLLCARDEILDSSRCGSFAADPAGPIEAQLLAPRATPAAASDAAVGCYDSFGTYTRFDYICISVIVRAVWVLQSGEGDCNTCTNRTRASLYPSSVTAVVRLLDRMRVFHCWLRHFMRIEAACVRTSLASPALTPDRSLTKPCSDPLRQPNELSLGGADGAGGETLPAEFGRGAPEGSGLSLAFP